MGTSIEWFCEDTAGCIVFWTWFKFLQQGNLFIYHLTYGCKFVSLVQVYEERQVEGCLVDYERVPITDEKSPKEQDFDILVSFND